MTNHTCSFWLRFSIFVLTISCIRYTRATEAPTPSRPLLTALEVTPVLGADAALTVTLPADFPLSNTRLRVGIFEHARPVFLSDIVRDFTVQDGRLRATVRLEADPGIYDVMLLTNDKAGAAFSQPAVVVVPGVRRQPGWWLLNSSPFSAPPRGEESAQGAPLFVSGLRRTGSSRGKSGPGSIPVLGGGPLRWRTIELPSLREMMAPGYDFAALRTLVTRDVQEGRDVRNETSQPGRGYLGFSLPAMASVTPPGGDEAAKPLPADAARFLSDLRQVLASLAPDAAVILRVDAGSPLAVRDIQTCAASCDAVVIRAPATRTSWLNTWVVKAARRIAEEQPQFDLPIFLEASLLHMGRQNKTAGLSDYLIGGATGIIDRLPGNASAEESSQPEAALNRVVQRNLPLFAGSVTLEDIGLLPNPEADIDLNREATLYGEFRAVQRMPLLSKLAEKKSDGPAESFVVVLGDNVTTDTMERIRTAATAGARIYVEGSPLLRDPPGSVAAPTPTPPPAGAVSASVITDKLATLLGGTVTRVDKTTTAMSMEDPWFFGLARGQKLSVEQSVIVKPIPPSAVGQIKEEKGKDVLTGPIVIARLADKSPGVIINPVGKGEVVWLPHRILSPNASANATDAATLRPWRSYYSALAAYMQPALVEVRDGEPGKPGASGIRVGLRSSAKGTWLLGLWNTAAEQGKVTVSVNHRSGVALDLNDEVELLVTARGNFSNITLTIPGGDWKIIAFGENRKELDQERNARTSTAKLR